MTTLTPARKLAEVAGRPYPNDNDEYRRARNDLLAEEIELRRHIERVAEQRRALPPGGEIAKDYVLRDQDGESIKFSSLFGRHNTLITIFWMFGSDRDEPCPMCASRLGSLDIPARDITRKVSLAIIARSPVERQLEFASQRGWRNLRFYQAGDDFARDYRGLAEDGSEWPTLDVWTRSGTTIRHFWGEELRDTADPGQDPREAPEITPLWNVLDLTPEGRGENWYPSLHYD